MDAERLTGHVLIVGYGRVGRRIGKALAAAGIPTVVADQNREVVESLRARGIPAVAGDAADPSVLIQAHVVRARMLVIAAADFVRARQMLGIAHTLRPDLPALVRVHDDAEAELLRAEPACSVFMEERELADAMTRDVLARFAEAPPLQT